MGSFSVCCGVTRLAIDPGDRCVLIPLVTPQYKEDKFLTGTNPVDNRGSCAMYYPQYPIIGRYDNYGRIDPDDTQSLFWEQMESKFRLPAEGFVEYADKYHKSDYSAISIIPNGVDREADLRHGMWVHEAAWSYITENPSEFQRAIEIILKTSTDSHTESLKETVSKFWGLGHRVLGYRLHLSDVLDIGGWSIMDAYLGAETDEKMTIELAKIKLFQWYCSWHNILIAPYIQIIQHGEPKKEIKHARFVMSIAQSRYDQYVADYGDEDDTENDE